MIACVICCACSHQKERAALSAVLEAKDQKVTERLITLCATATLATPVSMHAHMIALCSSGEDLTPYV